MTSDSEREDAVERRFRSVEEIERAYMPQRASERSNRPRGDGDNVRSTLEGARRLVEQVRTNRGQTAE